MYTRAKADFSNRFLAFRNVLETEGITADQIECSEDETNYIFNLKSEL